jgi:hypothetical protein
MSSVRAAESRADVIPADEKGSISENDIETLSGREQLYIDVLNTITNFAGHQQKEQVTLVHSNTDDFVILFSLSLLP